MLKRYDEGTLVWCRPRLVDEPKQGVYIRCTTEEERKQGYRYGHIVNIEGKRVWVRVDLCDIDIQKIIHILN